MEAGTRDRSAKENYFFLTSAVCPRPIAWVTSVDPETGVVNAAPFSWFQAVCADPPLVMLSIADRADGGPKDTLRNIQAGAGFVINIATREAAEPLVASSGDFPPEASEVEAVGLRTEPAAAVEAPRLAESPVHLECRLHEARRYGVSAPVTLVLAEVVHVHADDAVLDARGNVDPTRVRFLARLGGQAYASVDEVFEIPRPRQEDVLRMRQEGS